MTLSIKNPTYLSSIYLPTVRVAILLILFYSVGLSIHSSFINMQCKSCAVSIDCRL